MNEILQLLFLLNVVIFCVWLHFYKKYQVDSYRQDIFDIRDRLFEYAAEGHISFDHPAYKMTRTYLNGSLRFTERLSFVRMVIVRFEFGKHKSDFEKDIVNRLKGLTDPQKEYLSKCLDKAVNRTVLYLGKKNILIVSGVYFITGISILRAVLKYDQFKEEVKSEYKNVYSDAIYNEGELKCA